MTRLLVASALAGTLVLAGHAQSQAVVIRGHVVSAETGDPLPHARVVIFNDATPLPPIFTDAQGGFTSPPLAAGRYRLTATKTGYALTTVARIDPRRPTGVDVRMERSSSISGRVIDANGEPVIGMAVSVSTPRTGAPPTLVKFAGTDDLGEYRIGGLAAGTYVVAVNPLSIDDNGFVSRTALFFPGVATPGDAQLITIAPGDQKTGVDFSGVMTSALPFQAFAQLLMQPNIRISRGIPQALTDAAPKGTSVIRGRVTRTDGLPLAHATVTANFAGTASPYPVWPKSSTTDDAGRYEITELLRAPYRVTASKPSYTSASWGEQPGSDPPTALAVGDNDIRAQIDIALPKFGAIGGQILDDFGDPVEGVAVQVSQIRFSDGRRRLNNAGPAQSDRRSRALSRLRPAAGSVSHHGEPSANVASPATGGADLSGFAPTYFPGATTANEARQVAVGRAQEVSGIDVALIPQPTARITGKKIGSDGLPMGGSLVLIQSQRSGAIVTPAVGARISEPDNSRFEFPNVAPGEYVIQADKGKASGNNEGEFASQFITVNGADVTDLVLQATPGSTISGRVVFDGDGQPPPLTFGIVPARADTDRTPLNPGSLGRGEVQRDLTFEITGIHGPRRLMLDRRPAGWDLKAVVANGVDVTDAPLPFGTSDQSLTDVQVVLTDRLTEITGTATDARGQAVSDYALLIFSSDRERWYPGSRFFRRSRPEAAGNFTVRGLPPGEYFVAAVPSGASVLKDGVDAWQDPEFLESISQRATRATLGDGQKLSISARVLVP